MSDPTEGQARPALHGQGLLRPASRPARNASYDDVAIIRIEQLYPLRKDELLEVLSVYPDGTPVVWVQEEPKNMGAWAYMNRELPGCSRDRSTGRASAGRCRRARRPARRRATSSSRRASMAEAFGKGPRRRWRCTLRVPALGESISEATLGAWKRAEGDEVDGRRAAGRGREREGDAGGPIAGGGRPAQDPAQGGRDRGRRRRDRRD